MGFSPVAFFVLVIVNISHGRHDRCERITVPMCQDLGYNFTLMPNFMEHKDQAQAEKAVSVHVA